MKTKHILLRSPRASTRDFFLGLSSYMGSAASAVADFKVDVDEIEKREIPALSRDANLIAIAPAMPMKLIDPVTQDATEATSGTISWGVKAVGADTSPFTGTGIVVAILDTGVDSSHPAFSGLQITEQDFTGEGNGDLVGHGTHCAGTILGRDISGMRIGIARGIKKALIGKVLGVGRGGSSEQVCRAIEWAIDNGANVISMSLGFDFPGFVKILEYGGLPTELATSRALEAYRANIKLFEALALLAKNRAAFSQPTIIVAAAGNESRRQEKPDWEIAVSPPAVADGIISVAALGEGQQGLVVAPFSNTGANISAPGVNIVSASRGGGTMSMSGTSMATPHVAGVAALWAEKLRTIDRLNVVDLTSRLIGSADTNALEAGFDPFDVGAGLVRTPQ